MSVDRHPPRMRRRCRLAVLAAAALLGGCAALQIDVDVYKGPLINNEDMQRDQVLSMAMSAKPLLLEMRNKWLDGLDPSWTHRLGRGPNARRSALTTGELDMLAAQLLDIGMPGSAQQDRKRLTNQVRIVRQLNDVLSYYDDRGGRREAVLAGTLERNQAAFDRLMGQLPGLPDWRNQPAFARAYALQSEAWLDLLALLEEVGWADGAWQRASGRQDTARVALVDHLAERIAERTQPWLVACVLGSHRPLPTPWQRFELLLRQGGGNAGVMTGDGFDSGVVWSADRYRVARRLLRAALVERPLDTVQVLRQMDGLLRVRAPAACLPDEADINRADKLRGRPQETWLSANLSNRPAPGLNTGLVHGLVRAPQLEQGRLGWNTGAVSVVGADADTSDASPQRLAELVTRATSVTASGFDHGRIDDGIDRLADRYAQLRDRANRKSGRDIGDGGELGADGLFDLPAQAGDPTGRDSRSADAARRRAADTEFQRLEHMLVDFAARMQFLATNLWLVEEPSQQSAADDPLAVSRWMPATLNLDDLKRYKTMLEALSNNLLVHADDLRSRGKYRDRQAEQGPADRAAASQAFAVSTEEAFSLVQRLVRQRQLDAQTATAVVVKQDAELTRLSDQLADLKTRDEARLKQQMPLALQAIQMRALAKTLDIGQPKATKPPPTEDSTDTRAQQQADLAAANRALQGKDATVSFEDLRLALVAELKGRAAIYPADSAAIDALGIRRARRLADAVAALDNLGTSGAVAKDARQAKIAEFKLYVLQRLNAANQAYPAATLPQPDPDVKALEAKILARTQTRKEAAGQLTVADLKLVEQVLDKFRQPVMKQVSGRPVRVSHAAIRSELRQQLEAAVNAAAAGSADLRGLQLALQVVDALPAIDTLDLGQTAADATALQVLDNVIAQLRFQLIEKTRTDGPESEAAGKVKAALQRAMKDREQQVYIRPSSTYLRSVYTATAVQNDPSLGWRNMLLDRFKQIVKGDDIRNNTLVDLDKAFWQNINTVRVTAAGDSNFTLAKDDVGNWYVKAMGADPKAMIEAAKGMALYNLGGRFDANLLRIDELRQQADVFQRRGDAVPDDIKSELAGLSGAQSGAGVGARNQTLSLFVKNYDEQSAAHLKDLAAKLSAGVYQQALFDRWTASLQGGSNVRALDPLLADPDAAAQLQQATVAAAGEAGAEAPAAGMVKALQALNRLRSTLKTLVRGHTPLVAAELEAVRQSKAQLDALQPRLREADTQVVNADAAVAQAEEALKKSDTAATRQEDSRAREAAKLRRAELKQLSDQAVAERARLAAADVSLVAAQKRQAAAVADVDAVLKSAVEDFANRRLRVVEETETAVKVIGTATP